MAERRMLSKSLLMDNHFLVLSNNSKALYLYLLMFADDDGIVKRSMMIDSVLKVDNSNYEELQKNGLIIPYDDQVKVITHWNNLQTIRSDIYKQTTYLEFRSQLYIRSDYSYTKDADDKTVFSSADNWVRNGRPKNIEDFRPLINKYFQDRNGIRNVNSNDERGVSKVKYSKDKSRVDKNRVEQDREAQRSPEKKSSDKYLNRSSSTASSNRGMGKDASYTRDTVEIKNGNYIAQINQIMETKIPEDDERLTALFDDVSDRYKEAFIKKDLAELLTSIRAGKGQLPDNSVKSLVVDHLPESIKAVTTGEESH